MSQDIFLEGTMKITNTTTYAAVFFGVAAQLTPFPARAAVLDGPKSNYTINGGASDWISGTGFETDAQKTTLAQMLKEYGFGEISICGEGTQYYSLEIGPDCN